MRCTSTCRVQGGVGLNMREIWSRFRKPKPRIPPALMSGLCGIAVLFGSSVLSAGLKEEGKSPKKSGTASDCKHKPAVEKHEHQAGAHCTLHIAHCTAQVVVGGCVGGGGGMNTPSNPPGEMRSKVKVAVHRLHRHRVERKPTWLAPNVLWHSEKGRQRRRRVSDIDNGWDERAWGGWGGVTKNQQIPNPQPFLSLAFCVWLVFASLTL